MSALSTIHGVVGDEFSLCRGMDATPRTTNLLHLVAIWDDQHHLWPGGDETHEIHPVLIHALEKNVVKVEGARAPGNETTIEGD